MKKGKEIHILMISSSSTIGGGTSQMFTLGKNLGKEFKVFYAIPDSNNFLKYLDSGNHLSISERKLSILDIFKIYIFVKRNSIDLIHAHGKGAGVIARITNIFARRILIYTFHGIHHKCHNFFIRNFYIFYENLIGKIDDYKILVSDSEKKFAKSLKIYIGRNSKIIYNGVINKAIKKYNDEFTTHKDFSKNKVSVVSVCRFVAQKNIIDILKIAVQLPEINFLIVGDGELWCEISQAILKAGIKNIFLIGSKRNIYEYLYNSDIYLSTSLYEGLPISILEAMSVGLPVVASNVIGNMDTIEHCKSGYLYELKNINEAVRYIKLLSVKRQLRIKIGKNAFDRQRNIFAKRSMINAYHKLYKELNPNKNKKTFNLT